MIFKALFKHQKDMDEALKTFGSGNHQANGNAVDKAAESGEAVLKAGRSCSLQGVVALAIVAMLAVEYCSTPEKPNDNRNKTEIPYQGDETGNEEPDIRIEEYE